MKNYIFWYWSLLSCISRNKTSFAKKWITATLKDYKRWWYFKEINRNYTALAIIKDKWSKCNGILFEINEIQLRDFDQREFWYERIKLTKNDFEKNNNIPNDAVIWTYITNKIELPTHEFPIIQTYLDMVICWCLTYWVWFAGNFIKTTHWWDHIWVNDRLKPIFARCLLNAPIKKIDSVLINISNWRVLI